MLDWRELVMTITEVCSKLQEKYGLDYNQICQIRLGLEKNLNISVYAKPEFNSDQMEQIRLGLEETRRYFLR